jgi:hypothetical protein
MDPVPRDKLIELRLSIKRLFHRVFELVTSVACLTIHILPIMVICIDEMSKRRTYLNHAERLWFGGDGVIARGKG